VKGQEKTRKFMRFKKEDTSQNIVVSNAIFRIQVAFKQEFYNLSTINKLF
jgi:hypothetical protein